MVRPSERYRHGARRRGSQLVPVYMVTQDFDDFSNPLNIGLARTVEVYTGLDGLVATFNPWQLEPMVLANTEDPGLVDAMITEINKVSNRTITGSSWSGTQYNSISQGFEQLLNGVLYCTFVRTSLYAGAATVSFTQSFPGTPLPPSSNSRSESNVLSSTNYDVLTVGVDLESGDLVANAAPLYSHALSFDGNSDYLYSARYSAFYHGYREAVIASLPEAHPFKACGASAWDFLSNLGADPGDYSQNPSGLPLMSNVLLNAFNPFRIAHPGLFAVGKQSAATVARLQNLKGYSAADRQRVYGTTLMLELSDLSNLWQSCAGYALLGEPVATTFAEYSQDEIRPREDLLIVDGLYSQDQASQTVEPVTPAPNSLAGGTSTVYTTSSPIFFREAPLRPTFAFSSLTRHLSRHYWINS